MKRFLYLGACAALQTDSPRAGLHPSQNAVSEAIAALHERVAVPYNEVLCSVGARASGCATVASNKINGP